MADFSHPLLDYRQGPYACSETRASVVYLSEALTDFLVAASLAGLTPVIVSRHDAELTFALRYYLSLHGGARLVRDASREFINPATGARGASAPAVLDPATDLREAGAFSATPPPLTGYPAPEVLTASVALSAHFAPHDDSRVGIAADALAHGLVDSTVLAWGAHEPAALTWDVDGFTNFARAHMPDGIRAVLQGGGGAFQAVSIVRRTRIGIEETVLAQAPFAQLGTSQDELAQRAASVLESITETLSMPLVGSLTITPGWRQNYAASAPDFSAVPAAFLIGPRAVRALDANLSALQATHQISEAGRKKLPSLIAGVGRNGTPPWQEALEIAEAFGAEAIARAYGLDREER
ncbi:DUF6177 family protein [Microterricola viridarii]|uniref:Uncharacterized protein n=1 Tax=Microterricola viridarii TaxID=412690 RepID=A0A1H1NN34_9MICO|nr:DUF6177 family protein [Microterricola viridarii]SDS00115.1 hypothetical protein SAMN04489834_0676 [Microterricola viridarii]